MTEDLSKIPEHQNQKQQGQTIGILYLLYRVFANSGITNFEI